MKVIIMAGGRGTRFWPRSTESKPKQFLSLVSDEETMLQQAYRRYIRYLKPEDVYVLTCTEYVSVIAEQLPELGKERLIVEPEPKDTGPCIALAAHYFLREQFDGVLVTAPSDQYIPDADALMYALRTAEKAAQTDGVVVTLGIVPTRPETGYGYIQAEPVDEVSSNGLLPVASFIEKPTLDKAEVLIRQPNIYWNSGIFVWKPSTIARYMEKYCPDIWLGVTVSEARLPDEYAKLNKISIDYAIVEKAETLFTIPVSFPWDDVGTWKSLERVFSKDEQGNILLGDIIASDNRNSIIYSESRRVVVIGAEDLIIVSTDEGVLVCHKSAEQQIKQAIQLLYKNKGCEKP